MSTLGERAVGQHPHCRCQQFGVFARQVTRVDVHHGVADDGRQRLAVQNSLLRSAYCPPPALVAAMPGPLDTSGDVEHVVASSRFADRQVGTEVPGTGVGPSNSTFAPVPRSCRTRRVRLSIHAGLKALKFGSHVPVPLAPYSRAEFTTISWGCTARKRAMI